jgi:hypothetical protein
MKFTQSESTTANAGAGNASLGDTSAVVYAPLVINPVFGNSIQALTGTGADPTTAAEIENAVSAAINFYDGNFTSSVPAVINNGTISNTVTVNIRFDYGTIEGNVMAPGSGVSESESTGSIYPTYAQLEAALAGTLPDLPLRDPTSGGAILVPNAQAKVLGLSANSATIDGYVGVNTVANGVTVDYNLADQSISSEFGVLGVLEHEITEDLGRTAIDGTETNQISNSLGITTMPLYSILDLFRFTAPDTPAMTPGPADYFSLNNGTTDLGSFNDFLNGGDAGDWASSVVGDAFDAFQAPGSAGTISALDTLVLGAIGLLPSPELTISGTSANQVTGDTANVPLFQDVTIADRQNDQAETVTVTLSAPGDGTLSNLAGGGYDPATGVYAVSGSAATVTTALEGLIFSPTPRQTAAGQTVTTNFTINVTDTAGVSVTDSATSVVTTETANPVTAVSSAYVAILRTQPSTALLNTTVTQIATGQLSLAQFENGLLGGEQAIETTLPALVTIDAFYDATPGSALLTTVATATSGTSYDTAAELHNLGYSNANLWTILGAGWGADHGSTFFSLYGQDATGTTAGYTAFLDAAYQQEFGVPPAPANLQTLLGDIPGLAALLSGGGNVATPIQIMGGLYGYLLYAGETNAIGRFAASADAFLRAAAGGTVTYGPELTQEFPTGVETSGNVISVTSQDQLIDPGVGSPTIRFLSGETSAAPVSHANLVQALGLSTQSNAQDSGPVMRGIGVEFRWDASKPSDIAGNFPHDPVGGAILDVSRGSDGGLKLVPRGV